jgi:hypothetical protein
MNVLVYTRPRIKSFFYHLSKKINSFSNITYMSDHKGEEDLWIMEYYYNAVKAIDQKGASHKTPIDVDNVVTRCRYLRHIDKTKAVKKVKAMTLAIENIVDELEIDIVFGMVMDSYVLDLFDLVMRQRNSQYVGFLNNMLNGYSRLTSRGELIQYSEPTPEIVQLALADLSNKNYVPNMQNDFMWNSTPFSMLFSKYFKEKLKITYYFFKKIIDQDPDNFYFNTVASKECMSCRRLEQLFFRKYESTDWLTRVESAKGAGKKIVYFPLQFYPECSIDYWGTNSDFSDFYSVVKKILSNRYSDTIILAKEHPSAYGLRKTDFYKQFAQNENVILTPFDIPSNNVIYEADLILTWTGSVGVEAIMRGKPLITLGEAYYDPGFGILKLDNVSQLDDIEKIIIDHLKLNEIDFEYLKESVVKFMLKGLITGYVFPLDYATKGNPINDKEMSKLANGINGYILKLNESGSYGVKSGCI